jgi:hypothetical protein
MCVKLRKLLNSEDEWVVELCLSSVMKFLGRNSVEQREKLEVLFVLFSLKQDVVVV